MLFTDKRLVLCGLVVSLFEELDVHLRVQLVRAAARAIRRAIPRSSAQFAAQFGNSPRTSAHSSDAAPASRALRTPAFSAGAETAPPVGLIFATFMVACMGGSSFFALVSGRISYEPLLRNAFVVAAAALARSLYSSQTVALLISFLAFEAVVGVYWPAIGTIKSRVVPEEARATIYNLYRVPLNCVVLGVLLNDLAITTAFGACCAMLLVAAVAMHVLSSAPAKHEADVGRRRRRLRERPARGRPPHLRGGAVAQGVCAGITVSNWGLGPTLPLRSTRTSRTT